MSERNFPEHHCSFSTDLDDPLFSSSFDDSLSTVPNLDGTASTQPNLNSTWNYFPQEPTHFGTSKDTVTSVTMQVGAQANNDIGLSLQFTKTTEPTTAGTDRSSSSTGTNDFLSGVMESADWPGQPGVPMEWDDALTLNSRGGGDNNTKAISNDKPKIKKRGRPTGGGSTISLEQLRQQFGKTRKKAAEDLRVSVSTLKRVARGYEISYWQGPEKNNRVVKKVSSSPRNCTTSSEPDSTKLEAREATNVIRTSPRPAAKLEMKDATRITFKANFGGESILMFELPSRLKMEDVEQQVARRLELKIGSFNISYRDKDEDEWVLIRCDDDLLRVLHWTTIQIKVAPMAKLTDLISEFK